MNAVTRAGNNIMTSGAATSADVRSQIQLIQQVMRDCMIQDVHFGIVPGTPKPSLWKPGAEVLCTVFHIAPSYRTECIDSGDGVTFRVVCVGTHQLSNVVLGEGVGSGSSNETKYRWRAPVCQGEFDDTPEHRRRKKWNKDGSSYPQVRAEPADIDNTVWKMAAKRAQIAMVLNVTAASDIFTQDLEDADTPPTEGAQGRRPARAATRAPQSTRAPSQPGIATDGQQKLLRVKLQQADMTPEQLCERFKVESISALPFEQVNAALAYIGDPNRDQQAAE